MQPVVCPIDGHGEHIQKATAAMSGGTDDLRKRLARPEVPARPQYVPDPAPAPRSASLLQRMAQDRKSSTLGEKLAALRTYVFGFVLGWILGYAATLGAVIASVMIGGVSLSGVSGLGNLADPSSEATVGLFVGFVVASFAALRWSRHRTRALDLAHNESVRKYEANEQNGRASFEPILQSWEANARQVATAQELWSSRLYYCQVHDVIFLEGDSRSAPPEQMLQLLTGSDTVQEALRVKTSMAAALADDLPNVPGPARELYERERFEEALAAVEQLVRSNPDSVEAWILLSKTLNELWRADEALMPAEEAVRRGPRDPLALSAKAVALGKRARYQEASCNVELALLIDAHCLPAFRAKAAILSLAGQHEAALAVLDPVLAGGWIDFDVLLNKASVLSELSRDREILDIAQRLVQMRPQSTIAHCLLAAGLSLTGRHSEAIEEVNRAMRINPNDFRVQAALGAAHLAAGRYLPALMAYNQAVRMNPKSRDLRQQRDGAARYTRPKWLNDTIDAVSNH